MKEENTQAKKLSLCFGPILSPAQNLVWVEPFLICLKKRLSQAQNWAEKIGLNFEPFDSIKSRAENWAKRPKFWSENQLNFKPFDSNLSQAQIWAHLLEKSTAWIYCEVFKT
jgi:hypothetical protein